MTRDKMSFKPTDRIGVGNWNETGGNATVYGWLPFSEFAEIEPERVEGLRRLNDEALKGHGNPLLVLSDYVFIVPPAFIRGTRGLRRVDLRELLDEELIQDEVYRDMYDAAVRKPR